MVGVAAGLALAPGEGSHDHPLERAAVIAVSGEEIGEVRVGDDPARITLDLDGPATWPGTWTCEVRDAAGAWHEVGSWTASDVADRDWSSLLPGAGRDPVAMRLLAGSGAVLAVADLG